MFRALERNREYLLVKRATPFGPGGDLEGAGPIVDLTRQVGCRVGKEIIRLYFLNREITAQMRSMMGSTLTTLVVTGTEFDTLPPEMVICTQFGTAFSVSGL